MRTRPPGTPTAAVPPLSAHIGYLYTDLPLERRLEAAATQGFELVEHPEPWRHLPAADLSRRLRDLGLGFAQLTSGNGPEGGKGLTALPGQESAYRDGFLRSRDYALELGCPLIHPMAGLLRAEDQDRPGATYLDNLAWSARQLDGLPLALLIEPITLPFYAMDSFTAFETAISGAAPGARLLLDSYHAAVLGEDLPGLVRRLAGRIGHIHLADFPGRHEPFSAGLDFPVFLRALRQHGYRGAVGFEYLPAAPQDGIPAMLARVRAALRGDDINSDAS